MKKLFLGILAGLVISFGAYAGVDPIAQEKIQDIQQGADNANRIEDLLVGDDATVRDDASIAGDLSVSGTVTHAGAATAPTVNVGNLNVGTNLDIAVTSQAMTNGGFISVASSSIELSNVGQASTTTTNPLPASYSAAQVGRLLLIQAAAANTDSIHIAESAVNVMAATNLTLTANDSVIFQIVNTNLARQVSAVLAN